MVSLYLLLYVPLAGLAGLCLVGAVKLIKERRKHSRAILLKTSGAVLGVGLFAAGYAVMVVTHARGYRTAMVLVMIMSAVNLLRTNGLSILLNGRPHE